MKRPERVLLPSDGAIIAVVPDMHIPNEDRACVELMMEAFEDVGVTSLIDLGDMYDFFSISRWEKDPTATVDIGSLADEISAGRYFTDWCNKLRDGWFLLEGNHEGRYTSLIRKIAGLRNTGHTLEKLLKEQGALGAKATLLGADWRLVLNPDTIFEHGHEVRGSLRPKAEYGILDHYPEQTTIIGHTHKIFQAIKTVHARGNPILRRVYSVGHLSDESKQNYAIDPRWQQGFMIVTAYKDKMQRLRYDYHQVVIEKDDAGRPSFTLWGKIYR